MIELIVLDVDGCMTDGSIIHTSNGDEIKSFNVKDGLAIATWIKMGKKVAIITGRNSKVVEKRAEELKVNYLYQGVDKKDVVLKDIVAKEGLNFNQVAVIGDDLNDYKMLSLVDMAFAPSDASSLIHDVVNIFLNRAGGRGAIREMIEHIVRKENLLSEFLSHWR